MVNFGDNRATKRFWNKISIIDMGYSSLCWIWKGPLNQDGYGNVTMKPFYGPAHRVAYSALVEMVPKGLVCDHLCMNKACVNPEHIRITTQSENVKAIPGYREKAIAKLAHINAAHKAKTHCPHGHPYDEENTHITKQGKRVCKKCGYLRNRKKLEEGYFKCWQQKRKLKLGVS
jgi:hypothetical protein